MSDVCGCWAISESLIEDEILTGNVTFSAKIDGRMA